MVPAAAALANRHGGRVVLGGAVIWWSIFTFLTLRDAPRHLWRLGNRVVGRSNGELRCTVRTGRRHLIYRRPRLSDIRIRGATDPLSSRRSGSVELKYLEQTAGAFSRIACLHEAGGATSNAATPSSRRACQRDCESMNLIFNLGEIPRLNRHPLRRNNESLHRLAD
jgi:hypothetical protein